MTRTISNSDDVIDSRDVIARIEELEGEWADLVDTFTEADEARQEAVSAGNVELAADMTAKAGEAQDALDNWDGSDEATELKALKSLAEQAEGYADDWRHGAALVRESYFKEYAQQFADDIGAVDRDRTMNWPYTCIDWDAAADELRMDYTSVEFDGVTYWVR